MENQKSNSNLKAVIAILAVLLVGSLVYIFKMTSDAKAMQTVITSTKSDKESVMKDLEELKSRYDAAIAENTSMSDELIAEREKYNANDVKPGLTGWAQINGRDELEIPDKAKLDGEYAEKLSFKFDCKCFFGSVHVVGNDDSVVEGGTGKLKKVQK